MKKLLFAAVAAFALILPQIHAQEPESESESENNSEETADAPQTDGKKADNKAADPKKAAAADKPGSPSRKNIFAKQQNRIQQVMDKLKKVKKNSEKKRCLNDLKSEQNKLRILYNRYMKQEKDKVQVLQEQIKLCRPEKKKELENQLAAQEEKIQAMEADAALDKWCDEIKPNAAGNKAPDPGSGSSNKKKRHRSKKKK